MHSYGLMMVIDTGSQLALIRLIDHEKPVLEIQTTRAKLRDWRARKAPWLYGITGCLIWIPFLLVVFAALEGRPLGQGTYCGELVIALRRHILGCFFFFRNGWSSASQGPGWPDHLTRGILAKA